MNSESADVCVFCRASFNTIPFEPVPVPEPDEPVASPRQPFFLPVSAMSEQYYHSSGKASFSGVALSLMGGATAGFVLAAIYAYFIIFVPFIYVRILGTVGLGFGVGWATAYALSLGKIRNMKVAYSLIGAVSLITLYSAWVMWIYGLLDREGEMVSFWAVALQPWVVWDIMRSLNTTGVWSLKGTEVSGVVLWVVWAIEALIILGFIFVNGVKVIDGVPFCETCLTWSLRDPAVLELSGLGNPELLSRVRAKDYAFLRAAPRRRGDDVSWVRFDVFRCEHCSQLNVLKVNEVIFTVDNRGQTWEKSSIILDNLLISPSELGVLQQISSGR
ncbi:MAG: hypothetical protein HY774_01535 [Acidobacteria bacterium]|nr:hypothetical protein [Acidobacteriota bacterium]